VQKLHQCALALPEIGLIVEETSNIALESIQADLKLQFGEPPKVSPDYLYSLGEDQIVIIAGKDVNLPVLNQEELSELFSRSDSNYSIWTYGPGNELRAVFDQAILGEVPTSPTARLVSDPEAMLEAVAADPNAVGYVPDSWLMGEVQRIAIQDNLQQAFSQPVLAISAVEPAGNLLAYLVCLQRDP
jgi:hypothetical protein